MTTRAIPRIAKTALAAGLFFGLAMTAADPAGATARTDFAGALAAAAGCPLAAKPDRLRARLMITLVLFPQDEYQVLLPSLLEGLLPAPRSLSAAGHLPEGADCLGSRETSRRRRGADRASPHAAPSAGTASSP